MAMDQYLLIPFLGNEHPFTSYFDVHQGDRVLTHPQINQINQNMWGIVWATEWGQHATTSYSG